MRYFVRRQLLLGLRERWIVENTMADGLCFKVLPPGALMQNWFGKIRGVSALEGGWGMR